MEVDEQLSSADTDESQTEPEGEAGDVSVQELASEPTLTEDEEPGAEPGLGEESLEDDTPEAKEPDEGHEGEEGEEGEDSEEEEEGEEEEEEEEEFPPVTPGHTTTFFIHRIKQRLTDDGVELTCTAHVRCHKSCRMTDMPVFIICNETGVETMVELTNYGGIGNSSEEFLLKTGKKPGTYTWNAYFAHVGPKGSHGEIETTFTYDYYPHALGLNIWGIPTLYVDSGQVSFKVGAECVNFCSLVGGKLTVLDSEGASVADAELGEGLWPGSDALYWAEMTIPVPTEIGTYKYTVQLDGLSEELVIEPDETEGQLEQAEEQPELAGELPEPQEDQLELTGEPPKEAEEPIDQQEGQPEQAGELSEGQEGELLDGQIEDLAEPAEDEQQELAEEEPYLMHARYSKEFTISVHQKPEFSVSVTVIDLDTKEPVRAVARIHPARAKCDSSGLAVVPSRGGEVSMLISAIDYYTYKHDMTLTENAEVTIELQHKPENW
ncbi:MAG: hypothetical protein FWF91_00115 [Coriobacteriia bacterium]|nr:hypothetical protein [Coriobacteriia bacterium]